MYWRTIEIGAPPQGVGVEHVAPTLRHQDQVDVQGKNAVPAVADIVVVGHRPKYNPAMKRRQSFKYQLMPNGRQARLMRRFAGCCRFVFNAALALQQSRHEGGEKRLGYAALCREITHWRNAEETAWLAAAPVHPLQQAMKDLGCAYGHFIGNASISVCWPRRGPLGSRQERQCGSTAQSKRQLAQSCQ